MTAHLYGTGPAPLAASQRYSFRVEGESLFIPYVQRGSWDDYGVVERPEQAAFVERLLSSLGVAAANAFPGEYRCADRSALERVVAALGAALREPLATTPVGVASRSVGRDEAGAVSQRLTARFLELVSAVAGLGGQPFECLDRRIDSSGSETTRSETWRRGELVVQVAATAIESGHGVHGESATYAIEGVLTGERGARAFASIDMRSGGHLSVEVRGVLDAQALADAFVAP